MRRLSQLKDAVQTWRHLEKEAGEIGELLDLALTEGDRSLEDELSSKIAELEQQLQGLEFELVLSGEYDSGNALLAVHAGAGGTESQDWAQMLLRMYLRWAERRGFQADVVELSVGEEAGVKSALIEVKGDYAYGYLKCERGVHRLVRLSPFDADHARHTSFALIEVIPEVESEVDITISPDELKVETFRASGPGGQHMQKTSTAVRITHLPTGLVAICQNERSQLRNKETALKILRSRLLEQELERKVGEKTRLKGEHISAGWGNQIRSYVLHPYKLVKDHRTAFETSDTEAVLDGELDEFIEAYLKSIAPHLA
jgi:peptide chain release factor 2